MEASCIAEQVLVEYLGGGGSDTFLVHFCFRLADKGFLCVIAVCNPFPINQPLPRLSTFFPASTQSLAQCRRVNVPSKRSSIPNNLTTLFPCVTYAFVKSHRRTLLRSISPIRLLNSGSGCRTFSSGKASSTRELYSSGSILWWRTSPSKARP